MLSKTAGLFNEDNLKYFVSNSNEANLDYVKLHLHFSGVDTATFRNWMKRLINSDLFFQFPEDKIVVYFVEIPELNLKKLNLSCKDKNLPFGFID